MNTARANRQPFWVVPKNHEADYQPSTNRVKLAAEVKVECLGCHGCGGLGFVLLFLSESEFYERDKALMNWIEMFQLMKQIKMRKEQSQWGNYGS